MTYHYVEKKLPNGKDAWVVGPCGDVEDLVIAIHLNSEGKSCVYLCPFCLKTFVGSKVAVLRHFRSIVQSTTHCQHLDSCHPGRPCLFIPTDAPFLALVEKYPRQHFDRAADVSAR